MKYRMKYNDDIYRFYDTIVGKNDLKTTNPELYQMIYYYSIKHNTDSSLIPYLRKDMEILVNCTCPHCKGDFSDFLNIINETNLCPYCSNERILPGYNDLTTTHPLLVKELSPSNNSYCEIFDPKMFLKNDENYVFWICQRCGEEYRYKIKDRELNDRVCPYCGEKYQVKKGINDISTTHPQLAKCYSSNNNIDVSEVSIDMHFKGEFICDGCGKKEYKRIYQLRDVKTYLCSLCEEEKKSISNLYSELIEQQWCKKENFLLNLDPRIISIHTSQKGYWQCKYKHKKYRYPIAKKIAKYQINEETCPICLGINVTMNKYT